jgi:hypothetical protein
MTRRLGPPPRNVRYPIWAWYQYDSAIRRRPDLRHSAHLPSGAAGVLIEFEIEPTFVLLSDFDLWHYVLNHSYIPRNAREARELDRLPHHKQPANEQMKNSWRRIFDLEWSAKDIAAPRGQKSIQATVWQVPLAEIRSVRRFRAR